MEAPDEIGTPITSNFKRLDVDTLILDAGNLSGAKAEEEERRKWPFVFSPVQSLQQTAVRIHTADRDRYAPSSPLSPWPVDSRVSGQVGSSRVHCRYSPYNTVQQQRQQFPSQYSGAKDPVCGRTRASSSLMRKESRSRDGIFFRSRSRSRSPSVSPPLPPPPLVMDESPRSQDRTHQNFGQIPRSVCEEGAALERFLSLEVAPAAQKIFDAAVVQHSKACRLLDVEHIGGLVSLDSDQEEDERPSKRSPSRDSFNRDAKNEHASITNSSVGQNTSVASSDTVTSVNTPGASTEAWRRAVRAGVINIGSPSALTPRPSLPARKLDAYFAGAGDTCESPRWSISGRYAARKQEECSRKEFVQTPKAVYEEEPTEGVRKNARVPRHEGGAAAPDERRNESCDDLTARQECAEDSEEDDGLLSFSKQIAVDIGSKIVGLSSRIRRKAAEASHGLRNV